MNDDLNYDNEMRAMRYEKQLQAQAARIAELEAALASILDDEELYMTDDKWDEYRALLKGSRS